MKALFCVSLLVVACSKGGEARDPSDTSSPAQAPPVPGIPECVDEEGDVVECQTAQDCCQGFVCGKDPQRSHRRTYCIYGG